MTSTVRLILPGLVLAMAAPSALAQDLTLKRALNLAEQKRPIVQAAVAKLSAAKNARSVLSAYPATRFEFGDGTRPYIQGGEDLLLAQPIDLFNKVGAARAQGTGGVMSAEADLLQTRLDVQGEVISAYAVAASAQRLLQSAIDLQAIQQAVYDATKARVDAGDLPPAQLLRADLEVERAKQTALIRGLDQRSARARLGAVLGLDGPATGTLGLDAMSGPARQALLLSATLDARPDIRQSMADIARSNGEIRAGKLSSLPDFELQFRRNQWDMPEFYGLRFQVVWPIIDHGISSARTRQAEDSRRAAEQTLQDRRQKASAEIVAARLDLEAANTTIATSLKLEADALVLLQKEKRGYELGASTLLDVLDATRALRDIQEGTIQAQVQQALATNALLAATGTLISLP